MGVLKCEETRYYELDWDVPTEHNDKVYIAIKGNIQNNTTMPIMADGVGYEWKEKEDSKIRLISKTEFLEKARNDNVVYFYEDKENCNKLLDYPNEIQKYIDRELYREGLYKEGFKPHNKIPIREQLKILNEERKARKNIKNLSIYKKKEKGR